MSESDRNLLIQLGASLVVAVVTAFLTVRLALRRFRRERWWERKAEAYSRIVESLHHAKAYCEAMVHDYTEEHQYSDEHKARLTEEYRTAHREIGKATGIGAYILSDEAAGVLRELESRPKLDWNSEPPWDFFDEEAKAYASALDKMRQLAKKDLDVA